MRPERHRKECCGFSIIELVISIAIVLIISAIAIPQATGMLRSYRLSSAARGLTHQIFLVRLRATSDFTEGQLVIDSATNSYCLQMFASAEKAGNFLTPLPYSPISFTCSTFQTRSGRFLRGRS